MKKPKEMPVGTKVRGYGLLNEYGEFEFIPEQTGSRKGQTRVIKQTEEYTLSSTKHSVIVHMCLKKAGAMDLLKQVTRIMSNLIIDFKEYAF